MRIVLIDEKDHMGRNHTVVADAKNWQVRAEVATDKDGKRIGVLYHCSFGHFVLDRQTQEQQPDEPLILKGESERA